MNQQILFGVSSILKIRAPQKKIIIIYRKGDILTGKIELTIKCKS